MQSDVIEIRAGAKRNGFSTFLLGVTGLLISLSLAALLPPQFQISAIFLISASIVAMVIGWFKIREPNYSIQLSKQKIHYQHRHGSWKLNWSNVHRVGIPKVHNGLEHKPLSMVGIRLKDYAPLLKSISPRLATNLLMEQRALLLQNKEDCASGTCYSQSLIESDAFKDEHGKTYKGIAAMLGNRMTTLRKQLGYDLFISSGELDRTTDDFVVLMNNCIEQLHIEERQQRY
jgi:hypothetical protein